VQIKRISIVITIAVPVILLVACARTPTPQTQEKSSGCEVITLDEKLLKVAENVPGFGGMFFDNNGDLNVYLVSADRLLNAQDSKAREALIEAAITAIFGEDVLDQGRDHHPEVQERYVPIQAPRIKIVKGDYEILQLVKWRTGIDRGLEVPGVVLTDLDEQQNRLKVGIEPSASYERVEAALKKLGVPLEAVIIEETKPVEFYTTTRSKCRPVDGGFQIEADTGIFSYGICTMGFNAIRSDVWGFVTNSHCTKNQGGSEGTDFHQPNDPLLTESNKIGDEIADPQFFTGGACPSSRKCRYSDSAFVDYIGMRRGREGIARTRSRAGSITIDSPKSRFWITSETATPIQGTILNKVGRTTGWTYGKVIMTCMNINIASTNITLLCQNAVARTSGSNKLADTGDSGSPVFRLLDEGVSLYGILWGGPDDGSSFNFSSMQYIERDLGQLMTFDFPSPPPGPGPTCIPTAKQKCCGFLDSDKKCHGQCWPESQPCP